MAVQAYYGAVPAPCLSRADAAYDVEARMRPVQDYAPSLLLSAAAAADDAQYYNCGGAVASGAQSELTCNNGGAGLATSHRNNKRGREVERYVSPSSALLLPIPGMANAVAPSAAGRLVESTIASTSGRTSTAAASSLADVLVSEMCQHSAEIDAMVRIECERMRAELEQARKRQCQSLVRAVSAAAVRRLSQKEAELDAARRRAAELEDRLRQAAAESQAWCGLARSNEAVATGLRSTLDTLLRAAPAPAPAPAEGFGESYFASPTPLAAHDDAQSCGFVAKDAPATEYSGSSPAGKWACKSCGEGEATVLLLPCRHLSLCKACEPRLDACPVCLAAKNASVHIAMN